MSTAQPLVSVIVTNYNLGQWLPAALASVDQSTWPKREILLIDDGSTDPHTLEVLAEIEHTRPDIRLIRQENKGVTAARNLGIELANGELILSLDADNELLPHFLERAALTLSKHPEAAMFYGDLEYFGANSGIGKADAVDPLRLVYQNYIDNCAVFRKSAWQAVGGYSVGHGINTHEDWVLWLDFLLAGYKLHYEGQPMFRYNVRLDGKLRTSSKNRKKIASVYDLVYDRQLRLLDMWVADGTITTQQRRDTLARIDERMAYYNLNYLSYSKGLKLAATLPKYGVGKIVTALRMTVAASVRRVKG